MGDWFVRLLGFREGDAASVKKQVEISGPFLISKANGKKYIIGEFDTPSLGQLRAEITGLLGNAETVDAANLRGPPTVAHDIGDVSSMHGARKNRYALFQVASQLNCLEFVGPRSVPEMGVTGYANDRTQGPACAITCGAATVYRNYFAKVFGHGGKEQEGQTAEHQIECLRDFCQFLCNESENYFTIVGGYTMAKDQGLKKLNEKLQGFQEDQLDRLRDSLRVGVQTDVEVTSGSWGRTLVNDPEQLVTQVFGSACAVAYSGNSQALWAPVAQLILEASYEATLWAGVRSALKHGGKDGSRNVYLTALGGGVFGNNMTWVAEAIERAIQRVCVDHGLALNIFLVSYSRPVSPYFEDLVQRYPGGDSDSAKGRGKAAK